MNQERRMLILHRLQETIIPCSVTELKYSSPFELLIAVLLSARAKDSMVNKVTSKLYQIANTPQMMLVLGVQEIKHCIKSLGFFNKKAENIVKICELLLEKYDGNIPEDRKALESFPGIGRKTANIVLNIIFGWPTIAVDTHVFRVCNRTKFALGNNVVQVEKKLLQVVPNKFKVNCHRLFVFHGRHTCIARKPHCKLCVIKKLCEYTNKLDY